MPEEPRNDDQRDDSTPQWSGEVEPSTQPYSSPSDTTPDPFEPTAADETPVVYPGADYSALAETESDSDSAAELSSTPVALWGEPEVTTQPQEVPEAEVPVVPPVAPDAPVLVPVVPLATGASVVATSPKKSNKKPLIIGLVLAAIFVVFGGGSVLAYNLWYQNPEKVITDALMNAATAKSSVYVGTFSVDSEEAQSVVDMTVKHTGTTASFDTKVILTLAGKDYTLNGGAVLNETGDVYFKVEKLEAIVAEYKNLFGAYADPAQFTTIDKLVAKIDGTWIKISSSDLKELNETTAAAKTCANDAVKQFKDDKAAVAEVTDLYKKNPFVVIDKSLGAKDGSLGYKIKNNPTATKAFAEGLKTTKIYTTLHECNESFTIDTSDFDTSKSTDEGTAELWVSRWSHQITKMTFADKSDASTSTGTITPTYNQPVEIETPSKSITLKQLQADIEELTNSFAPAESDTMYTY